MIPFSPTFNARGELAFVTHIELAPRSTQWIDAVWKWSSGKLQLLLRSDQTTGHPGDTRIKGVSPKPLQLNVRGEVLVSVYIPSVGDARWLIAADGSIKEIVRDGEVFDFGSGQRRVVKKISSPDRTAGYLGGRRCLNDAGQVAFRIEFDDDTAGIYFKP